MIEFMSQHIEPISGIVLAIVILLVLWLTSSRRKDTPHESGDF